MSGNWDAIAALASCAAVLAALGVVHVQNKSAMRLTCLQIYMQIANKYRSPDMRKVRARLASRILEDWNYDGKLSDLDETLLAFFEDLGVLVRMKYLDFSLVWNTFGYDVPIYWYKLERHVKQDRNENDDLTLYDEFENLSKRLMAVRESPNGNKTCKDITEEAALDFLRSEERHRA